MKMEHRLGNAAVDVEKFSKLGTQDLQNNQPQRALESFKYSYKRSKELDDGYTERACAFNLGAVYIALGEFRKGVDTLEKSVPPENKREGRSNGDLYFNFGVGYEGLGNNEEAVRNYKRALDEYKVERDNVQMEAECLEKLAQIYIKMHNQFAAETFGQLAAAYEILNNAVKQMWALSEKASQLFVKGQTEEAESTADECLQLSSKCDSNANIGNLYNDLGLIYTQMTKYDKAVSCFEQALPLVKNVGDMKQEAVVLQNLGATFNFLAEFDKAVQYHQQAADLYAKLRNRNSQGQCFANLAFAHSQLGNIEEAGEAFLHAFQAAKDTGDRRTQWQVCEGLGAVAFTQKNYTKAIEYFKKALGFLAAADSSNSPAQDRIVAKLTKALEIQALGSIQAKIGVHKEVCFNTKYMEDSVK
ncbi:hypothetical protein FSP39_016180 [Pinctada imbricata]|uniref:Uncharacterized protein n=1 Tax=Pinctada imbricata TaxID=66713 RepID=A0AA88XL17_PINIB|nr:hypothetical protein FSP39_016180 [Pinctada imbricata]